MLLTYLKMRHCRKCRFSKMPHWCALLATRSFAPTFQASAHVHPRVFF
ncbi:hypothetical protein HMPREF0860_0942 [Treponema socranskii subsp. socranskii VPI DR56BR1116 = ATCC 35536]|uniref:Lipoprotein n=1 Tax=Treponema socranskii subsp. socranskii VPI DR56BR1116 = ATCC 35536 TaxID=1125725 RepID=A0ABN0P7G3_TRESO|nr:hypothetical protein HMPREF0860_0942 [Treponema socranskii subsp. socranskii VPI DR56BR1116 = ATCC 35536]